MAWVGEAVSVKEKAGLELDDGTPVLVVLEVACDDSNLFTGPAVAATLEVLGYGPGDTQYYTTAAGPSVRRLTTSEFVYAAGHNLSRDPWLGPAGFWQNTDRHSWRFTVDNDLTNPYGPSSVEVTAAEHRVQFFLRTSNPDKKVVIKKNLDRWRQARHRVAELMAEEHPEWAAVRKQLS